MGKLVEDIIQAVVFVFVCLLKHPIFILAYFALKALDMWKKKGGRWNVVMSVGDVILQLCLISYMIYLFPELYELTLDVAHYLDFN